MRPLNDVTWWQYAIALATVALALTVAHAVTPLTQTPPFAVLLAAVVIAAWYAGLVGGALALLLGTAGSVYLNLPPLYSLRVEQSEDVWRLGLFVLTGVIVIGFMESRQRLAWRLEQLLREAEMREQLLHQRQEEVVHASKLATIGQMAAGMVHELNNPLNNVNLFLGLLEDECRRDALERIKIAEFVSEAKGQIKRASDIVSHLRLFARGGHQEQGPCELRAVIHRALKFVQEPLRLASVTATFVPGEGEVIVSGNETQLEQVFVNLLLNAKDALSDSPTKEILIRIGLRDGTVDITVEDSGPGIPPELQAQLFTPFVTTKPPGKGLGLGLSICHSIVKAHRGTIEIESSPGHGARFRITLPLEPQRSREGHDVSVSRR